MDSNALSQNAQIKGLQICFLLTSSNELNCPVSAEPRQIDADKANNNMSVKDLKLSYVLELATAIVASVAAYLFASKYDVIEAFVRFAREHEDWELDEVLTVFVVLVIFAVVFGVKHRRELISLNRDVTQKNEELQAAMREIKQLKGIIPICANCKKIRDDKGYWHQVEVYIGEHTAAEFSHGLCPDCVKKLHPGIAARYHELSE